jgi:hypothetical protein
VLRVLLAFTNKNALFCVLTPGISEKVSCFEETCHLHLQLNSPNFLPASAGLLLGFLFDPQYHHHHPENSAMTTKSSCKQLADLLADFLVLLLLANWLAACLLTYLASLHP